MTENNENPAATNDLPTEPAPENLPPTPVAEVEELLHQKLTPELALQVIELTGGNVERMLRKLRDRVGHYGDPKLVPIDDVAEIVRTAFYEAQPIKFFELLGTVLVETKGLIDEGEGPIQKRGIRFA